ncbi:MAG: DUF1015 family protein [Clostridiales Family XIII bacterium]|jgi:uncharacterized protein (DUF1015 family)|nr:DUF1015 family protein [Clostridiales Family XIII bacterium]
MKAVRPFKAIRPTEELAAKVAALPYDVMNSDEAREMVAENPYSFLHVDKAEIDLDKSVGIYDAAVYAKAKENLDKLVRDGVLAQDEKASYFIYKLTVDGRSQAGIVACPAVDDYLAGNIKKHELTRADKEEDRVRHVDTLDANTGPIYLAHKPSTALASITSDWMAAHSPIYSFVADGNVEHTVWRVDDDAVISAISLAFEAVPALYIADGHHRCASAVRVAQKRRSENPDYDGSEEFNYFLAVIFPSDQLEIMDYNRLLSEKAGLNEASLVGTLEENFYVKRADAAVKPAHSHEFGLCYKGSWYKLGAKPSIVNEDDPVEKLDVAILQRNVLTPIFGIEDPRTDKRIDFAGGIRGLEYLAERTKSDMAVAFSMYPTTIDELMDIADAGEIMPPKSTWFEPKLLSGLFIHKLS